MLLVAALAGLLVVARFERWVKRRRAEEFAAFAGVNERARRFNAHFPECVFRAAPLKRRGVWRVGFYTGRKKPAFTM